MRHYLCCRSPALAPVVHAGRVFVAPGATLLIALAGLALQAQSGDVRALCCAVALATVTLAAHQDLRLAAGAQEKPAGLFVHGTSGSTPFMAGL
jgi:chromate transport protein ChrA